MNRFDVQEAIREKSNRKSVEKEAGANPEGTYRPWYDEKPVQVLSKSTLHCELFKINPTVPITSTTDIFAQAIMESCLNSLK